MIDLLDPLHQPDLAELSGCIQISLFDDLCRRMQAVYGAKHSLDFSNCSLERGWNLKFKKAGKGLCTVYPRQGFFTVMVVVGPKQKETVEEILEDLTPAVREIYHRTAEGGGQRWLMIDIEDDASVYSDVLRLIEIRRNTK